MTMKFASLAMLLAVAAPAVKADLVITDPTNSYRVGIGPNGELYSNDAGIGFLRSDGYDPLAPSVPRDSWGVATASGAAYADFWGYGDAGVASTVTSTANTARYVTTTANATLFAGGTGDLGLTVTQDYAFAAPNILSITTTLVNTSGSDLANVLFQRNIDWDVAPTQFAEISFGAAVSGNVIDSSYQGFENPDPSAPYAFSMAGGGTFGPDDLGGGIKINLGTLAANASTSFQYLYGINAAGESTAGLIAQVSGIGGPNTYYVATENGSCTAGTNPLCGIAVGTNSAVIAVAPAQTNGVDNPVPEPGAWPLVGLALGIAGIRGGPRQRSA